MERRGQTGGRGRVVLVHGFTQTGRSWDAFVDALAPGCQVLLVDLPGHGGSAGVAADLPASAELLADAGGRAVYVGYSLGGRVALNLALARPELPSGLVLLGATAGIEDAAERRRPPPGRRGARRALERDGLDAFLDDWLADPMFAGLPPERAQREDRRRNTVAGLASSLRLAGTGTQAPSWERLASIRAPVLVLAGARDTKFVALGRRLARGIGANATSATIPKAGHAAHLEAPEAFVAEVRPWLDRVLADASASHPPPPPG